MDTKNAIPGHVYAYLGVMVSWPKKMATKFPLTKWMCRRVEALVSCRRLRAPSVYGRQWTSDCS
jgi:hypothetical protein